MDFTITKLEQVSLLHIFKKNSKIDFEMVSTVFRAINHNITQFWHQLGPKLLDFRDFSSGWGYNRSKLRMHMGE